MILKYLRIISVTLPVWVVVTTATAADPLTVANLTVKLIEQRDVPARETGLLMELTVREGDGVSRGQILGKVDDRQARLEEKLAATNMSIANKRAENPHDWQLAEKDFDQQQELNEQQKLLNSIAHRKAENRVRVMAAEKAEAVAKNELTRATRARQEFVDSVSTSEIDGLNLAHQRMQLEAQQAEFELQIDALTAKSEDRASRIQEIKVQQSRIALEQAIVDQNIAQLQATASEHTANLADLAVERHKLISPIDGVVVHRYKQPGEWVKAGDPIVRVIHLNRLRAEGFLRTNLVKELRAQSQVSLVRATDDGKQVMNQGKIVFISPEVDPVNDEVAFWVEFDNADLTILPGMRVEMTTELP